MINWFNMPSEGLSNGGQFEIKELTATENRTYEKDGEVYSKVTVNVEGGGGGSSDIVDLHYTQDTEYSYFVITESPEDVYALINSGKNVQITADATLAEIIGVEVGTKYICFDYNLTTDSEDETIILLQGISIVATPMPVRSGIYWNPVLFSRDESTYDTPKLVFFYAD